MVVATHVLEAQRSTPVVGDIDVLVVGSGPGGLAAAVSASRIGARVLLLEEAYSVGGNLGLPGLQLLGSHMPDGRAVIGGFVSELYSRLQAVNAATAVTPCPKLYSLVAYNHFVLRAVALEMLEQAGVRLLLGTRAVDVVSDGRCVDYVLAESKSGRFALKANVVVDASGDADVVAEAGGAFLNSGDLRDVQPAGMLFRLGGVRVDELADHLEEHPEDIFPIGRPPAAVFPDGYFRRKPTWALTGLGATVAKAKELGDFPEGLSYVNLFPMLDEGQVGVNAVKAFDGDWTRAEDLTRGTVEGHRKVMQMWRFFRKHVPGFEDCIILDIANRLGVRESRRIRGRYVLTSEDVLSGSVFDDAIARGCYPIDVHQPDGSRSRYVLLDKPYDIPYRSLLPKDLDNVLVAGRPISADVDAFGSLRAMTHCMAIGQAAGTAAALAAESGGCPAEVDVDMLQGRLVEQGVLL